MFGDRIRNLYRINLNLKSGERLLVFTDDEKDYLVQLIDEFVEVGREFTEEVKSLVYPSLKVHGTEPPEELWRLTFGDGL